MGNEIGGDVARQAANVVGALLQAGMTLVASASIQEVVETGLPSLVEPAGYAFTIWALIFALSLVYAVYQALPTNRESPLLRRIGWFTAHGLSTLVEERLAGRRLPFRGVVSPAAGP